ncbi:MAG: hypothetical protein ACAI44_13200, partial [Candidatus Sericytochromatia bacterium]
MEQVQELSPPAERTSADDPTHSRFWSRLGMNARHRRYFLNAFWLALVLRLLLFGIGYLANRTVGKSSLPLDNVLYQAFVRWDANNFFLIAQNDYTAFGDHKYLLVFFPVYPWLLRSLSWVLQNLLNAALLLNLGCAVVAGYYLQCLVALDHDDETAHWALKYFFLFPTAYFLCMPYSEGLFLALTLGSWYEARQGRWGRAGLAGMLASLTRLQGLVLFPALLLEAWLQRKQTSWRRLLGVLLVPLGFGLYLLLNWRVQGQPFAFLDLQKNFFGNHLVPPWQPVLDSLNYLKTGKATVQGTAVEVVRLVSVIWVVGTLLLGIKRIRWTYQLYAWAQ